MAITPTQQKIRDKTITAKQFADMVKSGDRLIQNTPSGDATACYDELAHRLGDGPGQVNDIEFWAFASFYPQSWFLEIDPEEKYHCWHESFMTGWNRHQRDKYGTVDWHHWGWAIGVLQWYYRFHAAAKENRGMDWFLAAVSPPENGFFNWSYGASNHRLMQWASKKTVLEMREDYPWAYGPDQTVNIDDVDYIVEVDCQKYRWPQVSEAATSPEGDAMAEHLLKYMENGDCVQLGIGVIPTAICKRIAASGFKHLGVHTEMLQTGLMDLIDSGSVDNICKEYDYGKSVWNLAFPFDDKRYYDFVHKDERLCARDIYYTNNWVTLSRIPHLVALNNFTAIDLFGQSCASNYAGRIISNTGGQFEFTIGASLAKGGRGVQAATSTRKEKDGKVVSRIEPGLPPYTTVDIPAQFQQFVLTEYGIVDLRGLDGYERAKGLISIAHPDFREELEKAAYELHMVPPKFPISFDLKDRPFPDYHKERRDWKSPYMYMDGVTFENDVISGK